MWRRYKAHHRDSYVVVGAGSKRALDVVELLPDLQRHVQRHRPSPARSSNAIAWAISPSTQLSYDRPTLLRGGDKLVALRLDRVRAT